MQQQVSNVPFQGLTELPAWVPIKPVGMKHLFAGCGCLTGFGGQWNIAYLLLMRVLLCLLCPLDLTVQTRTAYKGS
jgi:hypothetical protein